MDAKEVLSGDISTFAEVKRADGRKEFFKVVGTPRVEGDELVLDDAEHVPISEAEYLAAIQEQT